MKNIVLFASIALLVACNTQKKDPKLEVENATETEVKVEKPVYGNQNYAVVWKWTTDDKQLVTDSAPLISQELTNLWKNGVVENAYYDGNAKVDKFEYFPNITFFLKAKSYESAEVILNKLTIVKKGIAVYTMYPVGINYLGRNNKVLKEKAMKTLSFVAVWETKPNAKPSDELTKSQSDAVLEYWKDAVIENVYFDIEGIQKANNETDFVFFVNANSKEEAKAVCDKLPFAKENIASYKLLPVGVFWLGPNKK